MRASLRTFVVTTLLLTCTSAPRAQSPANPTGHWEGPVQAPAGETRLELDLTRNAKGELTGTLSQPDQHLRGLPLAGVALNGATLTIKIPGAAGRTIQGDLSADGQSIAAVIETQIGPIAFVLRRTGEARIDAPLRSAPIGHEMEGEWTGKLEINGGMRVELTLANQPDGTSTGRMISVDEGRLEIPVAIAQEGAQLKLDARMVGGAFAGSINDAHDALVGVYTTREGLQLPLTLTRVSGK